MAKIDKSSVEFRGVKERLDLVGYGVEELRALVREGDGSGPGRFQSMAEIKAEARKRVGLAGVTQPDRATR